MSASDPREDRTLLSGIVGDSLQSVTRNIPVGEPPELPPNAELRVVGKRVNRVDAVPKVTGQARYTFDVQLPGMNGLELQRLLSIAAYNFPIIFITARADDCMRDRALKAGALAFLYKPFSEQALLEAVYSALKQRGTGVASY